MEDGRWKKRRFLSSFLFPHSSFLIPLSSPRVLLTQRPEDNLLVNPVDELGPEPRFDFAQKNGKRPGFCRRWTAAQPRCAQSGYSARLLSATTDSSVVLVNLLVGTAEKRLVISVVGLVCAELRVVQVDVVVVLP